MQIDPQLIARFEAASGVVPECDCPPRLTGQHGNWDAPERIEAVHVAGCTGRDTSPGALLMAAVRWRGSPDDGFPCVLLRGRHARIACANRDHWGRISTHDNTPATIATAALTAIVAWHETRGGELSHAD